jgi:ubiquinone/menaquinone biosynthesis C-methylase UbiE
VSRGAEPQPDHYSYRVYADPVMAERFDQMRFGGPIGRRIAETQEQQFLEFLEPISGKKILDVGTGTGRAAIALAARGAAVTAIDASAEMLKVAERRAVDASVSVTFARGDVHALDFADRSFDAVVCLRLLMHAPQWRRALSELCRVAANRLVLDFPARSSAAAIQALSRRVAHLINRRVEAYRVFSSGELARALGAEGFGIRGEHRLFVLPIALHKQVGSETFTTRVEQAFERWGVSRYCGSPVTLLAERCRS